MQVFFMKKIFFLHLIFSCLTKKKKKNRVNEHFKNKIQQKKEIYRTHLKFHALYISAEEAE